MTNRWEWYTDVDVWREIPAPGGLSTSDWFRVTVWVWDWTFELVKVPPVVGGGVDDDEPPQPGQRARTAKAASPAKDHFRNSLRFMKASLYSGD
jgi:hypothetical protein